MTWKKRLGAITVSLAAGALLLVSLLVRKRLRRDQDAARDRAGGEPS